MSNLFHDETGDKLPVSVWACAFRQFIVGTGRGSLTCNSSNSSSSSSRRRRRRNKNKKSANFFKLIPSNNHVVYRLICNLISDSMNDKIDW